MTFNRTQRKRGSRNVDLELAISSRRSHYNSSEADDDPPTAELMYSPVRTASRDSVPGNTVESSIYMIWTEG